MRIARLPIAILDTAMRLAVAIALILVLVLPHVSTAAWASGSTMAMDHMSTGHGDMGQMPQHHDKTSAALCATICLGADRFSSMDMPIQTFGISPVIWSMTAGSSWVHFSPDPALRPPDVAFSA